MSSQTSETASEVKVQRKNKYRDLYKESVAIAQDTHQMSEGHTEEEKKKIAHERRILAKKIGSKLIKQEKKHEKELEEGEIDTLTETFNRKGFIRRWIEEVSRLRRAKISESNTDSVILYIDANMLKQVNDEKGHDAGDKYLSSLAFALKESVRPTDTVARIGGDEFAVILPGATLPSTRELFETRIKPQLLSTGVSVSIGADYINPEDPEESKKHADEAMYDAKKLSRASFGTIEYREYGENIR